MSERKGQWKFIPDPPPKPVSASKWVPLAAKHEMVIDWCTKCVSTLKSDTVFWGADWCEPDVGAAVVKLAAMLTAAK